MSWIAEEIKEFTRSTTYEIADGRARFKLLNQYLQLLKEKYGLASIDFTFNENDGCHYATFSLGENKRIFSLLDLYELENNLKEMKEKYELEIRGGIFEIKGKGHNPILYLNNQENTLIVNVNYLEEDEKFKKLVDKIASDILKIPKVSRKDEISITQEE